ncbi:bifunctional aminoglycoside phosphotransferase/ATP-binding protein [Nonomuraea lactucae]|uniref:bifunctional aminoglycoside phosphotransferase/ATP-binding protein n=1 Tax=Nonomuraea lactucae TaxID=2249762 RepID=UPI001F06B32C|nr:AAA family ATPase [Nonomuraea lactucae]
MNLGFLDFTTREARQAACRAEVELNRRLAPDVYEGVADVLGPDGQPCEHVVVMRRMPDERRLATLIRAGKPVEEHVRQIARVLASLHGSARRGPEIDRQGTRESLRSHWVASFEQVRALPGATLDADTMREIERLGMRFLDGRGRLFAVQIAEGRIVEGHGDLLAEDIFCLDNGPRILDCLEFDERLRSLDGLDDAAFLAMDLERLGSPRPAEVFLHGYAVTLVLVGGPPVTERSSLAIALADRLDYPILSSDRIGEELIRAAPDRGAPPDGTVEENGPVHHELLARSETLLAHGESVVLDASWADAGHRAQARDLAQRTFSDLVELRCTALPQLIAERLARRGGVPDTGQEAISTALAANTPPWPQAVEIDTSAGPDQAVQRALDAVHARGTTTRWRFRRPQIEPG